MAQPSDRDNSEANGAEQAQVARKLTVALMIPLLALAVAGVALVMQLGRMSEDAAWVDHTDAVVAKLQETSRNIVEQESSLRAYMLTGDRAMLDAYDRAAAVDSIAALRVLVGDNPAQTTRAEELRRRYEAWRNESVTAATPEGRVPARALDNIAARRRAMTEVHAVVDQMAKVEQDLRRTRSETAEASARTTRYLLLGTLVFLGVTITWLSRRTIVDVARTFQKSLDQERDTRKRIEQQEWLRRGQLQLGEAMQGDLAVGQVGERALAKLAETLSADVGAFYTTEGDHWSRAATYGLTAPSAETERFAMGEGLVGQVGQDKKLRRIADVPADYLKVRSGTGERGSVELLLLPATVDGEAQAVIELGFLRPVDSQAAELLERVSESVGVAIRSARYKTRLRDLLEESQRQGEELQTQQEELRVANEELQSQSDALRQAHAQLEERKEELEVSNATLESQRDELQRAQKAIEDKAAEVERASRYKSEFLANMSHELRTPLNSSLILAKLLADNKHGNLTAEQVKFANTIYTAGNDLLALINDVLDLSKVEAGKLDLRVAKVPITRLIEAAGRAVEPLALEKKLTFNTRVDVSAPPDMETDVQRVEQILKNLLANAVKFTDAGEVSLTVRGIADGRVAFAVRDTGIGIAADQQGLIFEAFRQADGTSNRRHGGTGLGLSISRDLARLLGGDISVESRPGVGSTFTLALPRVSAPPSTAVTVAPPRGPRPPSVPAPVVVRAGTSPGANGNGAHAARPAFARDRAPDARTVLIVEDDAAFSQILGDLAKELNFESVVAGTADEGFQLAIEQSPSAILLDMNLPDHSGLSVLDRLKRNPSTRHIPVHIVSVADHAQQALSMGAAGYLLKPARREDLVGAFKKLEQTFSRRVRRLLFVDDDDVLQESVKALLGPLDLQTTCVGTVKEALAALRANTFDCIVTDLSLPDESGFDLLEKMASDESFSFPPVIVYTGRELTEEEEQRLRRYSSSIIVKGARSPERLLDEVTLFLHQVESDLPSDQQRMLLRARDREALFEGRRILLAEDDVRNIFALTSVLEPKGAEVLVARNGREAVEMIDRNPNIDIVLMDLMMPEMDGLDATRTIRQRPAHAKLPILAITAKAMRDDQERCLQAGANDYISKPIDVEVLLSLLRVWMPRARA